MSGIDGVGAIGTNPFQNMEWLSGTNGLEETAGSLASNGLEETSGSLACNEGNLFDGREVNGVDGSLFDNYKPEETSGQLASTNSNSNFCITA
ncbi:MAG: hypothetical protein LUE64_02535 [Candidatus Gastranaerophilales bacterium]|nr:hypothetical protein [Candidatus Gastranaerophilales bacterium]